MPEKFRAKIVTRRAEPAAQHRAGGDDEIQRERIQGEIEFLLDEPHDECDRIARGGAESGDDEIFPKAFHASHAFGKILFRQFPESWWHWLSFMRRFDD